MGTRLLDAVIRSRGFRWTIEPPSLAPADSAPPRRERTTGGCSESRRSRSFPLTVWLVASLVSVGAADHAQTVHWIRSPAVSIGLLLTVAALFHHAQLGLQVVIEDYVGTEWKKITALIAMKLLAVALATTAAFCVLKIAFES